MYPLIAPNLLIFLIISLAILNLFIPFISNSDNKICNYLLIIISSFFFTNILMIGWLFLKGIRAELSISLFGKFTIGFHLEALTLIFLTLISFLWIFALLYTIKYIKINNIDNFSRFLFFLNLSVLSGVMIGLSANLFTMFIFYEILTLSTSSLIAHSGGDKVLAGVEQYLKILFISGAVLFLPAVMIIYVKIGHGNFVSQGVIGNYFSKHQVIVLLLMFIFGISKTALCPLHKWLPAAMVGHYPVSSLLHAVVVVKSGLFCIYKILIYIFGLKYLQNIFYEFNFIILLPLITIIYSSLKALQNDNIKKILAYSTINQLAIALLSAFMFTSKSMAAAILHLCSHAFTKICLFYGMGSIYSLKKVYKVSDLTRIAYKMPKTTFIIFLSGLSLIGIPPFGGFISKFYVMVAAAEQNQIGVMLILALNTIFSALYLAKLLMLIYKPIDESSKIVSIENKLPLFMRISLMSCASGVIFFYFIQMYIKKFLVYIG